MYITIGIFFLLMCNCNKNHRIFPQKPSQTMDTCVLLHISFICIILPQHRHTISMLTIIIRTIIIYFVLVFSVRLMGKRQIGELQVSDFIVTIMLSEIAATPITTKNLPLLHAVVPIVLLLGVEFAISSLLLKFNKLKRLFYGSPSILICKGELIQKELKKNRIELDELLSELRQKGCSDISDVNYAILEENGKLSVFPYTKESAVTPSELSINVTENGIAHACVIDGQVIYHNLTIVGWTQKRLEKELSKRKLKLADVFLLTVNDTEEITIIEKEKKKAAPK